MNSILGKLIPLLTFIAQLSLAHILELIPFVIGSDCSEV